MSNLLKKNKKLANTLYVEEESVFREDLPKKEKVVKPKKTIPKPKLEKRTEQTMMTHAFYGVLLLTVFIRMGVEFYHVHFGATCTSILALLLIIFCYRFTNPSRWKKVGIETAYWNVSVTLSVLIKSIHPKLLEWRQILLWGIAVGLGIGLLFNRSILGVCFGLYLLIGLLVVAERELKNYTKIAMILAWLGVFSLIIHLLFIHAISLGAILITIFMYQVYERLNGLEIQYPESE